MLTPSALGSSLQHASSAATGGHHQDCVIVWAGVNCAPPTGSASTVSRAHVGRGSRTLLQNEMRCAANRPDYFFTDANVLTNSQKGFDRSRVAPARHQEPEAHRAAGRESVCSVLASPGSKRGVPGARSVLQHVPTSAAAQAAPAQFVSSFVVSYTFPAPQKFSASFFVEHLAGGTVQQSLAVQGSWAQPVSALLAS